MGMTQTVTVNAKLFFVFFFFLELCGFHPVGVLLVSLSLWDSIMMRLLTLHTLKAQIVKWFTCFRLWVRPARFLTQDGAVGNATCTTLSKAQ